MLVMTAQGSEEIAVQSLRAGAAGYVSKTKLDRDLPRILESILAITRAGKGQPPIGHCLSETGSHYLLPNDLSLIPPLVNRLQQNSERLHLFDPSVQLRIGMALRERLSTQWNMVISRPIQNSARPTIIFTDNLSHGAATSPYNKRRVHVVARRVRRAATYVIGDKGAGFDRDSLPDPTDPANLEKTSGRGLLLMRSFMDEVSHNARGNEITLVKYASGRH